jgi:hypothetical protein
MENISATRDEIFFSILYAYSTCKDNILEIFNDLNLKENQFAANIYNLIKFIGERSISITILVQNNLLWDAQIMMRCVQEATMKVSFLCNCSEEEKKQRLKEYLYDLEEINSLKRSVIAKRIASSFQQDSLMILPFKPLILNTDKEELLRAKWPSKQKRKLEQKWSYSEMMKEQANTMKEFQQVFLSLAHPYKISSHLLHADETAIGIIAERSLRNEEEKEKIETSHFCSLMSDSLNYLMVCGFSLCNAFKKDPAPFSKIYKDLEPVFENIEILEARVYEDPAYNKFKQPL